MNYLRGIFSIVGVAILVTAAQGAGNGDDTLVIGKVGSTANKVIKFGAGRGNTQPQIRYNPTSTKLEYANDGALFKAIGSGAGGSGGIELLADNADFENGVTSNWTGSVPATITSRTGTNALFGTTSARFISTATGQTYASSLYAVPAGLSGGSCLASVRYVSAEATNFLQMQVLDGSGNVLGSTSMGANALSGISQHAYVPFACPLSTATSPLNQVRLQFVSTGAAVFYDLDNAHLGSDTRLADVSQASFVGSIRFSSTGTPPGVSAQADLPSSGMTIDTIQGSIEAPASAIIGLRIRNMLPGEYMIVVNGSFACQDGASNNTAVCAFGIGDTANTFAQNQNHTIGLALGSTTGTSQSLALNGHTFHLSYSSTADRTIRIIGGGLGSGDTLYAGAPVVNNANIKLDVYRFPTSTETALRVDQLGWHVDASITGTQSTLSTTSVATTVVPSNASLVLTNNPGTGIVPAQIPCSGVNPANGNTCSAGNPELGITFNVPTAGDVRVCQAFQYGNVQGSGNAPTTFTLYETANANDATLVQSGKEFQYFNNSAASSSTNVTLPVKLCGRFTFASAGLHTIRLMYSINGANPTTTHWVNGSSNFEVYPINYQSSALPVFRGMVTSRANSGITTVDTTATVTGPTYQANDQVDSIFANTTSNAITITLPSASAYSGKTYKLSQTSNANLATWTTTSGLICGVSSIKTHGSGDGLTVQSDGTNWIGLNAGCEAKHRLQVNMTSTSAGTIVGQDGAWVNSIAVSGAGVTANYAPGVWSGTPFCSAMCYNSNSAVGPILFGGQTSTSGQFGCSNGSGALVVDGLIYYMCQGPR